MPTRFVSPAYSTACVPFRWMLCEKVEGSAQDGEIRIAECLKIGWAPDREPDIHKEEGKQVEAAWVQGCENQLRCSTPSSARITARAGASRTSFAS